MPSRDFIERMKRLREIVDQRVDEYDARHRHRRFPLRRLGGLRRSQDPRLSTVVRGADALGTTVGDLVGESPLGEADLQKLREFVEFLIARFDLVGRQAAEARDARMLPVTEAEFIA